LVTNVDRQQVQQLVHAGAELIEVMPADEYADAHIAGASNIPLRTLDEQTTSHLDKSRDIIVYCHDHQ
jgi:rhodanese-related sulfurtransferase